MHLYHFYDQSIGPFVNLSDMPIDEAKKVLEEAKKNKPSIQCVKRQLTYMEDRLYYEELLRTKFIEQGGIIKRRVPHYMVVEYSP